MTNALPNRRLALSLEAGGLALIYVTAFLIMEAAVASVHHELLGMAVWADLIVTAVLLHLLLGVRMGGLPRWTTLPVVAIGLAAARHLAPGAVDATAAIGAVVLVELSIAGVTLSRLGRVRAGYREGRRNGRSRLDALEDGLRRVFPPVLAAALRGEIEMPWLATAGWRKQPDVPRGGKAFTYHEDASWFAFAGVLIGLSIIETPLVHYLLYLYVGSTAAWIATGLSAYGIVWLVGDAQAVRLRPIVVLPDKLVLRIGVRWHAEVHRLNIVAAKRCDELPDGALNLSVVGDPNVVVELRDETVIRGLLGIARRTDRLYLRLDDPDGFLNELASH